ncbi:uncharacterized protein FSUBG_11989 [Fusarium subglutinans]|uniref:G domain-containing protein n=1 Tax=Gibberella subglutinans TaxID=42677 RepID=A0A8H5L5R5_GIBSU|nr:uncharacterized protein FSUBG_11989 [Fusarium subglutinans]KAF5586890.1 hypothetical protein FSUBG_11989 [Fusarium subglutinans]
MNHDFSLAARSPSAGDAVILVMGITGVGKSTFISKLTGEDAGIGHDLTSYTKGLGIYSMNVENRVIYLVDTPGFNDTWRSDLDILKEISYITSTIYKHRMKLAGILYLHRISDNRVSGSAAKNFTLLQRICGLDAASRVFLITTMWDQINTRGPDYREAEMRETRLSSTIEFWGTLCQQGSQTRRWLGDYETGLKAINELLALNEKGGYLTQQLQRELVDENRPLAETTAGRELLIEYSSVERKCAQEVLFFEQGACNEPEASTSLLEVRSQLRDMKLAQQELRVSLRGVFIEREKAYGKVLQKVCTEQKQLAKEAEKGRRDYQRLLNENSANDALLGEERQSWRLRRQELDDEVRLGHRTRTSAQEERQRIEDEENDFHESFQQLSLENEEQSIETQQMVEKLRKRDVMKRNLLPLLGVLGGTGLAIAGTVTGLAPLAGAGIGVGFAYASKLEFSRKAEDHTSSTFSLWEGVLGGGQGAAGASLD